MASGLPRAVLPAACSVSTFSDTFIGGNIDYEAHIDRAGVYDWWNAQETTVEVGFATHLITDHALQFIEANRTRPSSCWWPTRLLTFPTRDPRTPPSESRERWSRATWTSKAVPKPTVRWLRPWTGESGASCTPFRNWTWLRTRWFFSSRTTAQIAMDTTSLYEGPRPMSGKAATGHRARGTGGFGSHPCTSLRHPLQPARLYAVDAGTRTVWKIPRTARSMAWTCAWYLLQGRRGRRTQPVHGGFAVEPQFARVFLEAGSGGRR